MLAIKIDNNKYIPITTGKFVGSLVYNNSILLSGPIEVKLLHIGAFNLPFKISFYKINDKFFYYLKDNLLLYSKEEVYNFVTYLVSKFKKGGNKCLQ